jgi:tripartite-type tricarboxylate transporter receptor subunit TctC
MSWRWLAALAALLVTGSQAFAQSYPTRTVTIVVSSTPGSLPDVLARAVAQRLIQKWGHPVVVENKAGGAYAVAVAAVANAPADGYTLLATESGLFTTQPHLSKGRASHDARRDFVPVSGIASIPLAFVAHPSLPAKSIAELIALAKSKPGALNYGTAGPGTAPHMGMLLLEYMAGIKLTAVHYRGVSLAVNDLLGGTIQLLSIGPTIALPSYKAGKLKILGVGSPKRAPLIGDDIPAVAETVPGFEMTVSFSLLGRSGMPDDIIAKVNADVQEILKDAAFQKQVLEPQGLQPMIGSAADLARFLAAESDKWAKLIRDTNLSIE